jgi:small subunit ribosomal protein S1
MSEFENLLNSQEEIKVGDIVKAVVEQVDDSQNQLIVSLPGGVQGVIPVRELSTEKIDDLSSVAHVGDEMDLVVYQEIHGNAQDEGLSFILSKNRLLARAAWEELSEKVGQDVPVKVLNTVKGGLSVLANGVRGFIPASMIDVRFVSDFKVYVGKEFDARVIEVDIANNRLILSRRAILEEEQAESKAKILAGLHEGEIIEGRIARLTDFGAFIDLGGMDGLVHVSEIAHNHVSKPADVLSVGEKVKVKVLNVNPETARVSLSIKATLPGPWDGIEEKAPVGSVLEGTVKRLTTFGAFVELFPGVEGLVHISQISHDHIELPQEKLAEGEIVQVKVIDLSPEEHRIGLSIKDLLEKPAKKAKEEVPPISEDEIAHSSSEIEDEFLAADASFDPESDDN